MFPPLGKFISPALRELCPSISFMIYTSASTIPHSLKRFALVWLFRVVHRVLYVRDVLFCIWLWLCIFSVELPLHASIVMVLIIIIRIIRIIMVSRSQIVNYDNLFLSFSTLCYHFLKFGSYHKWQVQLSRFCFLIVLLLLFYIYVRKKPAFPSHLLFCLF